MFLSLSHRFKIPESAKIDTVLGNPTVFEYLENQVRIHLNVHLYKSHLNFPGCKGYCESHSQSPAVAFTSSRISAALSFQFDVLKSFFYGFLFLPSNSIKLVNLCSIFISTWLTAAGFIHLVRGRV